MMNLQLLVVEPFVCARICHHHDVPIVVGSKAKCWVPIVPREPILLVKAIPELPPLMNKEVC